MENSMEIIHFVCGVKNGRDRWEGEAFYPCPDHAEGWQLLTRNVAWALARSLPPLLDLNQKWSVKMNAERYFVHGPLASAFRRRISKIEPDSAAMFSWTLAVLEVWSLTEEPGNG